MDASGKQSSVSSRQGPSSQARPRSNNESGSRGSPSQLPSIRNGTPSQAARDGNTSSWAQVVRGEDQTHTRRRHYPTDRPSNGSVPPSIVGKVTFKLRPNERNEKLRRNSTKIYLSGRNAAGLSREALIAAFIASGIDKNNIVSLWRGEDEKVVNITFTEEEHLLTAISASPLYLSNGITAIVKGR